MDGDVCEAATRRSRAHARRAAAGRSHRLARAARHIASPTSISSRSSPAPDRSPACASAWRRFRASRSRADRAVVPVPTLDALAHGWLGHTPLAGAPVARRRVSTVSAATCFRRVGRWRPASRWPTPGSCSTPRVAPPEDAARGSARLRWPRADHDRRRRRAPVRGGAERARSAARDRRRAGAARGRRRRDSRPRIPSRRVAPHALRPIYVRRPDAELARERAHARAQARAGSARRVHRRSRA